MSISGALSNAYSGLVAASRSAEMISNNVANVATDGFGRREIELSSAALNGRGAGVRVVAIRRNVNQIALSDRRMADADASRHSINSSAYTKIESAIGLPGDNGSLTDLVSGLQSALVLAQSRPDQQARQQNIFFAASDLVAKINTISNETQHIRMSADKSIAHKVDTLNTTLIDIAALNKIIRRQIGSTHSVNGLMDQRQVLVDKIASIVPLKIIEQNHGQMAIFTKGGAILLDGTPARFEFTVAGLISPDMTIASGALSGLKLNGKVISVAAGGPIDGGGLAAEFDARDQIAPTAQAQVDALARNLMERFEGPGLDPTVPPGRPGLFTDGGAPFDNLNEQGLAQRLRINSAIDPNAGGFLWRLRDGLGATVPGNSGDNKLLTAAIDALSKKSAIATGQFSTNNADFSEFAINLTATNISSRLAAEGANVFSQARLTELQAAVAENGVSTDHEMRNLMLVQQAYAANARVIATVEKMMQKLMDL